MANATSRSLRQGFTGSFAVRCVALALGLGVNVLLARFLGPTEFGSYAFALTVILLLGVPFHSGTAMLLTREVARDAAAYEWGKLRGSLRAAHLAVLSAFTVVGIVVVPIILIYKPASGTGLWLWALLLFPFYSLATLRGAVLRGLQRAVLGQIPDLILRPALLSLAVLPVSATMRLSATTAMAAHVAAALATFLIGTALVRRVLPPEVRTAIPEYHVRSWLRSVLPLSLIVGIQAINSSLAVLLLGRFGTLADVGYYRVADLGSSLVLIGFVAGDMILAPRIAALHAQGDLVALQRQVTSATQLMVATALPVALLTTTFGEQLLRAFFGELFLAARWPLFVLSIAQCINVGIGAVGSLLVMTGHEREALGAVAAATILNLVLGIVLVPRWGTLGAALASGSTLVTLNLFMHWRVRRSLGIRSTPW